MQTFFFRLAIATHFVMSFTPATGYCCIRYFPLQLVKVLSVTRSVPPDIPVGDQRIINVTHA